MLTESQLARLEERLLEERRRAVADLRRLGTDIEEGDPDADVRMPTHLADRASDEQENDMDIALAERLGERLGAIDDALERLRSEPEGFDRSAVSGERIPFARLELLPWTRTLASEETDGAGSG